MMQITDRNATLPGKLPGRMRGVEVPATWQTMPTHNVNDRPHEAKTLSVSFAFFRRCMG